MERYRIKEEGEIPSPALIYYKDTILENLKKAIAEAGTAEHLWPHVKSHKMKEILKLQMEAGIRRFKCATLAETEAAASVGAEHILLAYPLVGPNQRHFLNLMRQWPGQKFYVIGDDEKQLKELARQAEEQEQRIHVFIDVNTGMNRTGVRFSQVERLFGDLKDTTNLSIAGFHCYDGNRHEKNIQERKEQVKKTMEEILSLRNWICRKYGYKPESLSLILGGSPTFPCYASMIEENNIFYSPGTIFIYDAGYREQFPDLSYEPGAAILTRVVSHPSEGYFTIDCGYKAISAEQIQPGVLLGVPHATPAFQSEEHWTFCMETGYEKERPEIGQVLYVLPWHICPTTALYEKVFVAEQGRYAGIWKVSARNRLSGVAEACDGTLALADREE